MTAQNAIGKLRQAETHLSRKEYAQAKKAAEAAAFYLQGKSYDRCVEIVEKANRHARRRLLLFGSLFLPVLLSMIGAFVYFQYVKPIYEKDRYEETLKQVGLEDRPERKIDFLKAYLQDNADSKYAGEIGRELGALQKKLLERQKEEKRLETISAEQSDFYFARSEADILLAQEQFDKALATWTAFSEKYPASMHGGEVSSEIGRIKSQWETRDYEQLARPGNLESERVVSECTAFMERHPESARRNEISTLISEALRRRSEEIRLACGIEDAFDVNSLNNCEDLCAAFVGKFPNSPETETVRTLMEKNRGKIRDKAVLSDLERSEQQLGDRLSEARKLYEESLRREPSDFLKRNIESKLAAIDQKLREQEEWERVRTFARNETADVLKRCDELETYIEKNTRFRSPAEELLGAMASEREEALGRKADLEARKAREDELKRQEQLRIAEEQARKSQYARKIENILNRFGDRFRMIGDEAFVDKKTGLTWYAFDARFFARDCCDYDKAVKFVGDLKNRTSQEWRLPDSTEFFQIKEILAQLAESREEWYWTSKTFAKGWNHCAYVHEVRGASDNQLNRASKELYDCGNAMAVK